MAVDALTFAETRVQSPVLLRPSTVLAAGSEVVSIVIQEGGDVHFGSIQAPESPSKAHAHSVGNPKALEVAKPASLTRSGGTQNARMVGAEGFEPPTLCSQSRCATRLRYAPTPVFDCIAKIFASIEPSRVHSLAGVLTHITCSANCGRCGLRRSRRTEKKPNSSPLTAADFDLRSMVQSSSEMAAIVQRQNA